MVTETDARLALDEVEGRLHDLGTHAVAACVAAAIVDAPEVSMSSAWRARSILRAIGRELQA